MQDALQGSLKKIGILFGESQSLEEFQANLPRLEQHLGSIQDSVDQLGLIKLESSTPGMTEYVNEPVPDPISSAMNHFDEAINALVNFTDKSRSRDDIEKCLRASEHAVNCLREFLKNG